MEYENEKNDMNESIQGNPAQELPEVVKEEPNDKPAGLTVKWTIIIAVVILAIIYFVFFY